ncbi:hypothetical protein CK203_027847 [Vitis vinifera]|uniref:Uncharacterized protein n=1 Tax=Vitis vinifera TaxID=29760 RepID=A0A438J3R3_VITVI|nr:hypothetical protein CK203_027847 [Vitis vinifera]
MFTSPTESSSYQRRLNKTFIKGENQPPGISPKHMRQLIKEVITKPKRDIDR